MRDLLTFPHIWKYLLFSHLLSFVSSILLFHTYFPDYQCASYDVTDSQFQTHLFFVLLWDMELYPINICPFMLGSVSRDHRRECNTIARERDILFSIQWAVLVQHCSSKLICKMPQSLYSSWWLVWSNLSLLMASFSATWWLLFWTSSRLWLLADFFLLAALERWEAELLSPFLFIFPQCGSSSCCHFSTLRVLFSYF